MPPVDLIVHLSMNNSPGFRGRGSFLAVSLNTNVGNTNATLRPRFSCARIPPGTASGATTMIQRYLWGAESWRTRERRRERHRVELHDVDDDITRAPLPRVFLRRARNLSSASGDVDRGSQRIRRDPDAGNAGGWNRKNSRRARALFFSALPTRSLE